MRRINLLPPEERRRGLALPTGGLTGVLAIAGVVAVVIMIGLYVFYQVRINGEEERIAELDGQIAQQNQRIAELEPYRDLQARLDAKQPVADGIYRSRFAWDEFFGDLALVIPDATALDSLAAQASPVNTQATPGAPLEPPGSVTFTGLTLPSYQNVADFVVQTNTLDSVANTTLNSAELDRETFAQPGINFEVDSELITQTREGELPLDDGAVTELTGLQTQSNRESRKGR